MKATEVAQILGKNDRMVSKSKGVFTVKNSYYWGFTSDGEGKLWDYIKSENAEIGEGIILYGEIYGAGIQKNYEYGLKDIKFAGFDVTIDGKYESTIYTEWMFGPNMLQLPHVEVLYEGTWNQEIQDSFVFNNFIEGTKVPHEGIVIKHVSGERNKVAKVINPDYLIYGEKNDVGDSH